MRSLSKPFDTLVSFHYFGGNQEPWVRRLAAAGCRTIGDSGAYSAMSLGKPVDLEDAWRMWRLITSAPNTVTSSLAVICKAQNYETVTCDSAWVYLKPYDAAAVEAYLAAGDYADKAGAYAVQHIGDLLDHIEGSEDTILGLPLHLLAPILAEFSR